MLNQISSRVYYMDYVEQGDRPVLGLVVGDTYSLVIDGGNSKAHAEEFLREVGKLSIAPIKYLVLTHWHWDHVCGVNTINAINIVQQLSHKKLEWMRTLKWTNKALKERVIKGEEIAFCEEHIKIEYPSNDRKLDIPKAEIIFEKKLALDLGGVIVEVEHLGGDHSKDSVAINVEEEKIVFMGDAMYQDMYHGPFSYSREKLYPLLDKLEAYEANYYIPAHHSSYTNKTFKAFVMYIKEIGDIVGESINIQEAIKQFEKMKLRKITEEEREDLQAFVEGNKKSK